MLNSLAEVKGSFSIIRELVNQACTAAILRRQEYPDFLDGERINWQNLRCTSVGYGFNDLEQEYHIAFVEDADPSAKGLNDFIRQWVALHGYDIIVDLDW